MIKQKLLIFFGLLFSLGVEAQTIPTAIISPNCNKNGITCRIGNGTENGRDYVDLGLSVLWATCNVGATTPEGYGDYFAWGEISPKSVYERYTYKYGYTTTTMTKYCTSSSYGTVDNKTTLELSDDAAHVNWGGNWRMPTMAEQDELRNNCTWTWTTLNGITGHKVTSKVVGNTNSIFLPAAGYRIGSSGRPDVGYRGNYWSSSLSTSNSVHASYLEFRGSDVGRSSDTRFDGRSVRAVCSNTTIISTNYTLTLYAEECVTPNSFICSSEQQVNIAAEETDGYLFTQWSDGNTDNPRLVTMTNDVTYTAQFLKFSCSSSSNLTSITFSNISADMPDSTIYSKGIEYNNRYYEADENDCVVLTGIAPNSTCTVNVYVYYNGKYYKQQKIVSTKTPSLSCSSSATQTTVTLSNISVTMDESVTTFSKGIYYEGKHYETDNNDCMVLTGIAPNHKCTLQVYGCYNGQYYYGSEKYITTQSINPTLSTSQVTPTSVYVRGSYTHGDATILGVAFSSVPAAIAPQADEGYFTGLKPNTSYTLAYEVGTKEGGIYSTTQEVTTPALELTTLTPKVVSAGKVVVAASTNISDMETNVGFEWRKYNAPPELPSSRAQAILYKGQMEGILHNLSLEYWKVRAYYEAADGTCYYGEWATFDPSQPAYFEPTVHTYALVTDPTANKVQIRGYVMTGTDDVTEQGFEYWFKGAKAPRRVASATPDSVYRVQASGQVMTAVLEDLAYSTTYTCRAYAVAGGKTYYGEEVQFLTPEDPRPIYTLSVMAGENGSVNTDVSGQYREGETVTLTATAEQGFRFVQWSDGNTDNPRQLTMTANTELMAIFELADGLEQLQMDQFTNLQTYKLFIDNQLYIFHNGKTYNAVGGAVR